MTTFAFVGAALFALLEILTPQPNAAVSTLKPLQRAFVETNEAARVGMMSGRSSRRAMNAVSSEPLGLDIRWRYEPTSKEERELDRVRFRVVLVPESAPFEAEWHYVSATNALVVDNLRVAEAYRLEVAVVNGRARVLEKVETRFATEDRAPRLIRMGGVRNVRDLGGWKTLDGRRVRQGLVYRSQGLNDNADWCVRDPETAKKTPKPKDEWKPGRVRGSLLSRAEVLARLGIRTELDLRRPENETWGMSGSPLGPSVRWVNRAGTGYEDLASGRGRAAFADHFRLFLNPTNYPIVFHCIAGADRTGSLAYALNGLLGVSEADLDLDYQMTCFAQPWEWPGNRRDPGCTNALARIKRAYAGYPGKTINERIEGYVRSCGFSEGDIVRFRGIMFGELPIRPEPSASNVRELFESGSSMHRRQMMQDEGVRRIMHQVAVRANLRDMGGWSGLSGCRVRTNRIYRCAALEREDRTEVMRLFRGAVPKTELDLRTPEKVAPLNGVSPIGARYVNMSAPAYEAVATSDGRAWFAGAFRLFLDEANYPIVFHCAKGADRTGTLAFLLNGLLGVCEDDLLRDWQTTAFWNPSFWFQTERYDRLLRRVDRFEGDSLTDKIVSFVRSCGITDEEIRRFRMMMLEDYVPEVRVGVLSDVHLKLSDRPDVLQSALKTLCAHQVNVVIVSGDLADTGRIDEYARFLEVWKFVFANPPGKGGAPGLFIVWGNHDCRASSKDRAAGVRPDDADGYLMSPGGKERVWRMLFDEPYPGEVYARTIHGVVFVGAHWGHEDEAADWLESHASLVGSQKPFFYVQHPHPSGTVFCGMKTGAVRITEGLAGFPNAFAISGHSHTSLADETALWQGAFTSMAAGALCAVSCRHGEGVPKYANGYFKPQTAKRPYQHMPSCACGPARHCAVITVRPERICIARLEPLSGRKVGDDWILPVPLEVHPERPFANAEKAPGPEFPANAAVSVSWGPGCNAMGEPERQLSVKVEQARAVAPHGRPIYNTFDVVEVQSGRVVASANALQAGQALPLEDATRPQAECVFPLDALPCGTNLLVRVTPRNAAGVGGRPCESTPFKVVEP